MKNPGLGDFEGTSALSPKSGMAAFWGQDQRQAWRKQDRGGLNRFLCLFSAVNLTSDDGASNTHTYPGLGPLLVESLSPSWGVREEGRWE